MNIDDLYRIFVEKINKIRLFRNQIDEFFSRIFDNNNLFIFKIFKIFKLRVSFISFIAIITQTRITLYFKFINLFVAKSSNNAICETMYDSKKLSIRFLYAQAQTFVYSFFLFIAKMIVNSIIATIEKTKYNDIKSIRLFEIFEIVFAFAISRLKSIVYDSFISKFADFFHVCRICYGEFNSNNNLHSHLRTNYSFSSNRDY